MIVGEAKTSTKIMEKQLCKYLNTGLFVKGYEMHPDKASPSQQSFGLFNISTNHTIQCFEPTAKYDLEIHTTYTVKEYSDWIGNYIKFYLLANFTQQELNKILQIKTGNSTPTIENLINLVNTVSLEEITKNLQEVL